MWLRAEVVAAVEPMAATIRPGMHACAAGRGGGHAVLFKSPRVPGCAQRSLGRRLNFQVACENGVGRAERSGAGTTQWAGHRLVAGVMLLPAVRCEP